MTGWLHWVRWLQLGWLASWLLLGGSLALAQPLQPVPPLQARVTDLTGTLNPQQRQQLEAQLAAIEQRKGSQVAVLIVPTTQPEAIEQYALRVAEAWKLGRGRAAAQRDTGQKGTPAIDDGVLVLVAKNDRKVRIEVGYGLEGAIPDAVAKRIIIESISPRFREGDFHGGLLAAVADLGRRIEGEDLPAPWQPGQRGADDELGASWVPMVLIAFVIGLIVSRVIGRLPGAALGGGIAGVAAAGAVSPAVLAGVIGAGVFLAVLMFGGGGGGGPGGLRRVGRRTIGHGPVIVPGGGWGGGGGGGFGGGGFGGGGGGFGGGGASGDW